MEPTLLFKAKNGAEITIRPAAPDDAAGLVRALKSSSPDRSYVLMDQYGKTEEAERQHIASMDPARGMILVALDGGSVVGCLAALQADKGQRPHTEHIIELGLHLIESHRGIGIGTRMIQYAVEWATEHGFKKVVADIFTSNKHSLRVFTHAGFDQECVRKNQIRLGKEFVDEVCMAKYL